MKTVPILLSSVNSVKEFVNAVNKYDFEVNLIVGSHIVDAKSILGIFSLDLLKPIKTEIHSDDCDKFLTEINEFVK